MPLKPVNLPRLLSITFADANTNEVLNALYTYERLADVEAEIESAFAIFSSKEEYDQANNDDELEVEDDDEDGEEEDE